MTSLSKKSLPRVPFLRVKDTRVDGKQGTCVVAVTNLLNCWASYEEGAEPCKGLENELKDCMMVSASAKRRGKPQRLNVNYHPNRLLKKINPPPHD